MTVIALSNSLKTSYIDSTDIHSEYHSSINYINCIEYILYQSGFLRKMECQIQITCLKEIKTRALQAGPNTPLVKAMTE